ncbi:MAG: glycoside hydrolase family 95 protein [Bryobacter sp.]|nr:glycoside hydrolase family 95 protein [Bryobacter sp.]
MRPSRRQFLAAPAALAAAPSPSSLRLWYRQPAPDWNEALPIGNGRLGAMVFGGVPEEHLQLNEDTLYSDEPGRRDLPLDVTKHFDEVQALLRAGRYPEADALISKHWCGRAQPCYQPLGDLYLRFEHGAASNYTRELNLEEAIARVAYDADGVQYTREILASHPAQLIVIRLTASRPVLTFTARLASVHPTAQTKAAANELVMTGQAPGFALRRTYEWIEQRGEQWKYPEIFDAQGKRRPGKNLVMYGNDIDGLGARFAAGLRLQTKGGTSTVEGGTLRVAGAREAVLLLSAATSFNGPDKSPSREGKDATAAMSRPLRAASGFASLRKAHMADYQSLFSRVALDLGPHRDAPTDERIVKFSDGGDPGLAALYFHFGRYLMIAGSRPGTQPLNLQGIWNPHVIPPWAGAYTTNINVEMNYWPAEAANLSECYEPFWRMTRECAITGARVAKSMYHRRGWTAHHNVTLWRDTQPVDNNAMPSFWPMAAAWFCQHVWDHWEFTRDRAFLKEAYPVLKGASEFLLDWLVEDAQGNLVTAAGNSPENLFLIDGKPAGITSGCAMDLALTRELFTNTAQAAELLGIEPAFRDELRAKAKRLAPFRIGARGQLQEWPVDFPEREPKHRHISHLYALHPSNQITPAGTPELAKAARQTLELRGDEGTGWSRAWKVNFWARLQDGNRAYKLLRNLFAPAKTGGGGVLPNLFCSHPPFQIDGNFGGAAGIAEMLLQSHAGEIHLLPALPEAWRAGSFRGLCARGGFVIDAEWSEGRLRRVRVVSRIGGECRLRLGAVTRAVSTRAGQELVFGGSL